MDATTARVSAMELRHGFEQAEYFRKLITQLRARWYTSPSYYGWILMNTPRHKKKGWQRKGTRTRKFTNF